jgi:hypothetical protein
VSIFADDNIVERPPPTDHDVSPWIDEQIWGHRLHDAQTPWLLFLEFLTVAEACHREYRLFDEQGVLYPLNYKPYKRMFLRNILFNSEFLSHTENDSRDSNAAWRDWLEWMKNRAQAVPHNDFSYLKSRFRQFKEFASLVATVRSSAVESDSNRRWTSRFVFPFGTQCLYEDLNIKNGEPRREYINFGRTGELLYLMLCRSSHTEGLNREFSHFFDTPNQWNSLVRLFQPDGFDDTAIRGKSYLPYRRHPIFDQLAEDWLRIFGLRLPGFDAFEHLVRLGAFHVMLYQLNVAAVATGRDSPIHMVCEAIAPKKTLVRELSASNYQDNNALPTRAIESYISKIEQSDDWMAALAESENEADAFARCRRILEARVWWGDEYEGASDPQVLIAELRDTTLKRHRRHVGSVHRIYGREIGLVSKRGTNKLRYAPTDSLLKTLLLANVPKRMELGEFLNRLYHRYGFVFDDQSADQALPGNSYDRSVFKRNVERLEQRLTSLGMLRRLSDSCAYVENPHTRTAA